MLPPIFSLTNDLLFGANLVLLPHTKHETNKTRTLCKRFPESCRFLLCMEINGLWWFQRGGWARAVPPKVHKPQSAATFLGTQRSRDISGQTGTWTLDNLPTRCDFHGHCCLEGIVLAHCTDLTRQESPEMTKQCCSSPGEIFFCFLWASKINLNMV